MIFLLLIFTVLAAIVALHQRYLHRTFRSQTFRRAFQQRYGPWAIVLGCSEGIGLAYTRHLATLGLQGIVGVALPRDAAQLEALETELHAAGVAFKPIARDLCDETAIRDIFSACRDVDVGLCVFNASFSPCGSFLRTTAEQRAGVVACNVASVTDACHRFARLLVEERKRSGGLVLMSSIAGMQGTARVGVYSASKAYMATLAEALHVELEEHDVDVLAVRPGPVSTPAYLDGLKQFGVRPGLKPEWGLQSPEYVAERALLALYQRRAQVIPGLFNVLSISLMHRLLPRQIILRILGARMKQTFRA